MDVAAISPVRPVTLLRPSPDLSRVYEVEYLGQSREDEYTPANRKAVRGLEDEEEEAGEEAAAEYKEPPGPSLNSVSLFA